MIESTLFTQLKTLGYSVTPIGPESESPALVGNVDGPVILYRIKNTQIDRFLSGEIAFEQANTEILVTADTSQQATSIAGEIRTLLDNQEADGYTFFLENHFVNDSNLTVIHQWYNVIGDSTASPPTPEPEPTILWQDSFAGVDNELLNLHTPEIGTSYAVGFAEMKIKNNKLVKTNNTAPWYSFDPGVVGTTTTIDFCSGVDWTTLNTVIGTVQGIGVRTENNGTPTAAGQTGFQCMVWVQNNDNVPSVQMYIMENVSSYIDGVYITEGFDPLATYTIEVVNTASTITMRVYDDEDNMLGELIHSSTNFNTRTKQAIIDWSGNLTDDTIPSFENLLVLA